MERRDRSLKALEEFQYIDSLDNDNTKAEHLQRWVENYLSSSSIEDFELNLNELKTLEELFFKNINFLKSHHLSIKEELNQHQKIKKFLKN